MDIFLIDLTKHNEQILMGPCVLSNIKEDWGFCLMLFIRYPETATAIAYQTQGFFEQAQTSYEQVRIIPSWVAR